MITSTANPQIKNLIQLQKKNRLRQEQGIFIIEGIKMYREAPTDQVIKTYVSESFYKKHQKEDIWKGESLEIVTDRVFEAASDTKTPQGVLSLVKRFEYHSGQYTADHGSGEYSGSGQSRNHCAYRRRCGYYRRYHEQRNR